MIVNAYKTHKIQANEDLYKILDKYLPTIEENAVVIITSKIVSLCQGDVIKHDANLNKNELIKSQADWYYTDDNLLKHWILYPTIKEDILIANAGIDESNADEYLVLWPKNVEATLTKIWQYLKEKHKLHHLGVIITDSRSTPLRWGTQGVGISWCGFEALKDYRNKPDIFGHPLKMTQESILDGLASAAVVVMGEGDEQTPLAMITDVPFVVFQTAPPTKEERAIMRIEKEKDIYGKMLTSVEWKEGK